MTCVNYLNLTVTSEEARKRKNEIRGRCFRFNAVTLYHDCCREGCFGYEPGAKKEKRNHHAPI